MIYQFQKTIFELVLNLFTCIEFVKKYIYEMFTIYKKISILAKEYHSALINKLRRLISIIIL